MKEKNRTNKGITLITLIITIIVLLIVGGVSIATLIGENGILTRANDTKVAMGRAEAKEKVQIEVLGSYDNQGIIDIEKLNTIDAYVALSRYYQSIFKYIDNILFNSEFSKIYRNIVSEKEFVNSVKMFDEEYEEVSFFQDEESSDISSIEFCEYSKPSSKKKKQHN